MALSGCGCNWLGGVLLATAAIAIFYLGRLSMQIVASARAPEVSGPWSSVAAADVEQIRIRIIGYRLAVVPLSIALFEKCASTLRCKHTQGVRQV